MPLQAAVWCGAAAAAATDDRSPAAFHAEVAAHAAVEAAAWEIVCLIIRRLRFCGRNECCKEPERFRCVTDQSAVQALSVPGQPPVERFRSIWIREFQSYVRFGHTLFLLLHREI